MKSYKSVRVVDVEQPIVLSFDVAITDTSLSFGIENYISLTVDLNENTGDITEIIENSLISDENSTHENDTLGGEKVIIEQDESMSGVVDGDGNIIADRPALIGKSSDNYIEFDSDISNLSNGSVIFFLTENPLTDNVIYSELGVYEERYKGAVTITPFVLEFEENNPILLDVDEHSLSFLLLGHECTKDFSKSPTTKYTKTVKDSSSFEYQDTNQISESYRARFVISNNGRIIAFSVYNKDSKQWDVIKELIFDTEKIDGKHHVVFSVSEPNAISNITANF